MRILIVFVLFYSALCVAVVETFAFENEAERRRYHALIGELRCPKCQNQNLAGSDAPIAQDLREQVYRQIKSGASDQEILDFMHNRYGDFVLYRPRLTLETLALWLGPLLLVLVGAIVWWRLSRAESTVPPGDDLSLEEERVLREMLEQRDD